VVSRIVGFIDIGKTETVEGPGLAEDGNSFVQFSRINKSEFDTQYPKVCLTHFECLSMFTFPYFKRTNRVDNIQQ